MTKAIQKKQLPTLKMFQTKIRVYIATGEAIEITTKQRKCWTSTRKNKTNPRQAIWNKEKNQRQIAKQLHETRDWEFLLHATL